MRIESSIRASDGDAILARWEFGRQVLAQRVGSQLPKGRANEIAHAAGISQTELRYRTLVADVYPSREEVVNALTTSGSSWRAILAGLPKRPKATPKPPPLRLVPNAATIKEADRVVALMNKPDVAAEVLARDKADEKARKARSLAERQARAEAREQKERDQERLQIDQAMRQQLIKGDANWQNLTEQMEIWGDTVTRYLSDGLVVPDPLRLSRLDTELAKLQQRLFELRCRLKPDYQDSKGGIGTRSVIDVASGDP